MNTTTPDSGDTLPTNIAELPWTRFFRTRFCKSTSRDGLTHWVEAAPTTGQTAASATEIIDGIIICRHGCPQEILSDTPDPKGEGGKGSSREQKRTEAILHSPFLSGLLRSFDRDRATKAAGSLPSTATSILKTKFTAYALDPFPLSSDFFLSFLPSMRDVLQCENKALFGAPEPLSDRPASHRPLHSLRALPPAID